MSTTIYKSCPKCSAEHTKNGTFCSRKCANSRGPRNEEFKRKIREKLTGKNNNTEESLVSGILKKGQTPKFNQPYTICSICGKSTLSSRKKTCSKECFRTQCKLTSQANPKCGGKKQTHKFSISNIKGRVFICESSYELKTAEILNSIGIEWIRPKYIWYTDSENNKRRYYPDFYLPLYNIYLDPKNSYLIKTDIDKINRAGLQNNLLIVILGINAINQETIEKLVGNDGNAPSQPACKTGALLLC